MGRPVAISAPDAATSTPPRQEAPARSNAATRWLPVVLLIVAYVPLAVTFNLLTPAYEGDDEGAHTQYIEYIAQHGAFPHIGTATSEAAQPPLYYLLAAGWQEMLRIPGFTPEFTLAKTIGPNTWILNHDYTPTERVEARYVHELRVLSTVLGLGTVLLSYAAARILRLKTGIALSVGLFVALLPRELVLSSNVTNDALAIPVCALALVLFLLAERARSDGRVRSRRIELGGMGLALGAAALTKFTTLPLAAVLLVLAFLPSVGLPRRLRSRDPGAFHFDPHMFLDGVIALLGFLAVSGWWFIHDELLYGQFLAQTASENDLGVFARPIPWSSHLFFVQFPSVLLNTTWYAQLFHQLPPWVNDVLAVLAIGTLIAGAWVVLTTSWSWTGRRGLAGLALLGGVVAGLATEVLHIKTTSIGDARLAFICIVPLALLLVLGSVRLASVVRVRSPEVVAYVWPALFAALDVYVLAHVLVPHGGF